MWDLIEVSRETFEDCIKTEEVHADLGDLIDDDIDIAVCHYTDRYTGAYVGTMRITEFGTIYLMPESEDSDAIEESELYRLLYGE